MKSQAQRLSGVGGKLRPKVSGVWSGPQGEGQSQAAGSEDCRTDGQELDADLLPEFIVKARTEPEGAKVGAGRSQGWGLGGLGGKSRGGQDGQVLRAGVTWQREGPVGGAGHTAPAPWPQRSLSRNPLPINPASLYPSLQLLWPQPSVNPVEPLPRGQPHVPGTTLGWGLGGRLRRQVGAGPWGEAPSWPHSPTCAPPRIYLPRKTPGTVVSAPGQGHFPRALLAALESWSS